MFNRLKNLLSGGLQPAVPAQRQRCNVDPVPQKIYAIGDVHGCMDELASLEKMIIEDAAGCTDALIIMLGDYVDRGPASATVLDHLAAAPPAGFSRLCLAGNHEQMMLNAATSNDKSWMSWLEFGGRQTLESYGAVLPDQIPTRFQHKLTQIIAAHVPEFHLEWLANLPSLIRVGNIICVHAGIRSETPIDQQLDSDLLWIRDTFLNATQPDGLTIIHGHTPTKAPVLMSGRIGIDTGCYGSGQLTALYLENGHPKRILQTGPERITQLDG